MSLLIENLERMLAQGEDNAALRYGLGKGYLTRGEMAGAVKHLEKALEHDPESHSAWTLLGKAYQRTGRNQDALCALKMGLDVATRKEDEEAVKAIRSLLKSVTGSAEIA